MGGNFKLLLQSNAIWVKKCMGHLSKVDGSDISPHDGAQCVSIC